MSHRYWLAPTRWVPGRRVLFLTLAASCSGPQDPSGDAGGRVSTACEARAESRWVSAAGYAVGAEYGRRLGEELGNFVRQMAVARDSILYVYDVAGSRVVALSPNLTHLYSFGRRGPGPGELMWQSLTAGQQIGVIGDRLAVHDLRAFQLFEFSGDFAEFHPVISVHLSLLAREIVAFAGDDAQIRMIRRQTRGAANYSLEFLSATADELKHYATLQGPPVPTTPQGWQVWAGAPRQAIPIGHIAGHCAYMQNGGAGPLVLHNAVSQSHDSLTLPLLPIRPYERVSRSRPSPLTAQFGLDEVPSPTELWRWTDIKVDPDGHIWLRAWAEDWGRVEAAVLNPASGEHIWLRLPGFPIVFGGPGVFYTVLTDSATDIRYIARVEAADTGTTVRTP